MQAPTLYFLKVTEVYNPSKGNQPEDCTFYEVWEQHQCQEKGCFKTEPTLVGFKFKQSEVEALIEDWRVNPPLNGVLADVEWEHLPSIPLLEDITSIDAHGVYHNLTELVLAIAELSSLKVYECTNELGDFAGYTFEVVE